MYKRIFRMMSKKEKLQLIIVSLIQSSLNVLDLIGVALVGILGALSIVGIQSKSPDGKISRILNLLSLQDFSFQKQMALLGLFACIVFISRTFLSLYFTKRILHFLSMRSATISNKILSNLLNQNVEFIQKRSSQQILNSITSGVMMLNVGVIGASLSIVSDTTLLAMLSLGILFVDWKMTIFAILYFGLIGIYLNHKTHSKAKNLGRLQTDISVKSYEKILEALSAFREIHVRNRKQHYIEIIGSMRSAIARFQAESSFMPYVSKYVIETALVIGALLISLIQFLQYDATKAFAMLSIFIASGSRIAPAFLRIQQGSLTIKAASGSSTQTFDLIDDLEREIERKLISNSVDTENDSLEVFPFKGNIEIKDVKFSYKSERNFEIDISKLEIDSGKFVAFAGPSGSGKTTIIDIMLGLLTPSEGFVKISGTDISQVYKKWPGKIGYVPQESIIFNGTIRENVALGFNCDGSENETNKIEASLDKAKLLDFVKHLPLGIDSLVGERGIGLSGGQKQRLGIARAIYTNPEVLVLDEATSSLDSETEIALSESIKSLKGNVTIVVIAHRLSTILDADSIYYIQNGKIVEVGDFNYLRSKVPEFNKQTQLLGIN